MPILLQRNGGPGSKSNLTHSWGPFDSFPSNSFSRSGLMLCPGGPDSQLCSADETWRGGNWTNSRMQNALHPPPQQCAKRRPEDGQALHRFQQTCNKATKPPLRRKCNPSSRDSARHSLEAGTPFLTAQPHSSL